MFSDYSYDGGYRVKVRCDVDASATYARGEAEDTSQDAETVPSAFERTGMSYFVLDADLPLPLGSQLCLPGGPDMDGDGIIDQCDLDTDGDDLPDSLEAVGDTDGDGTPSGQSSNGDWTLVQGVLQHPAEADDQFATRLWVEHVDSDQYDDLIVMSPGDCGGMGNKGFNYVFGSASGLTSVSNVWYCKEHQ